MSVPAPLGTAGIDATAVTDASSEVEEEVHVTPVIKLVGTETPVQVESA